MVGESRDGVELTNLDQPLFDGADATKRDLVDYLDGVRERILPELADRPLSVIRVHRGQEAFMQKNVPKYTPEWVRTVRALGRDLEARGATTRSATTAARSCGSPTNARSSTTPPSRTVADPEHQTPSDPRSRSTGGRRLRHGGAGRPTRPAGARPTLGLDGVVKTSGAKGVHVFVPVVATPMADVAAATRAIAARAAALGPDVATTAFLKEDRDGKVFVDPTRVGGGTVVAAYSPRVRPGVPVSFPAGVGRARRGEAVGFHDPHGDRRAGRTAGLLGRPDAGAAVDPTGAARRGACDPGAARRRDARGQAARPESPRRLIDGEGRAPGTGRADQPQARCQTCRSVPRTKTSMRSDESDTADTLAVRAPPRTRSRATRRRPTSGGTGPLSVPRTKTSSRPGPHDDDRRTRR